MLKFIRALSRKNEDSARKLEDLFSSLQQRAFTGELFAEKVAAAFGD